jgi:hypothetical protein
MGVMIGGAGVEPPPQPNIEMTKSRVRSAVNLRIGTGGRSVRKRRKYKCRVAGLHVTSGRIVGDCSGSSEKKNPVPGGAWDGTLGSHRGGLCRLRRA